MNYNSFQETWPLHCDSAKAAKLIEKYSSLKEYSGIIQNSRPVEIIVQSVFHKKIAVHLIRLSSL